MIDGISVKHVITKQKVGPFVEFNCANFGRPFSPLYKPLNSPHSPYPPIPHSSPSYHTLSIQERNTYTMPIPSAFLLFLFSSLLAASLVAPSPVHDPDTIIQEVHRYITLLYFFYTCIISIHLPTNDKNTVRVKNYIQVLDKCCMFG